MKTDWMQVFVPEFKSVLPALRVPVTESYKYAVETEVHACLDGFGVPEYSASIILKIYS